MFCLLHVGVCVCVNDVCVGVSAACVDQLVSGGPIFFFCPVGSLSLSASLTRNIVFLFDVSSG
jgi:hypothetical protein